MKWRFHESYRDKWIIKMVKISSFFIRSNWITVNIKRTSDITIDITIAGMAKIINLQLKVNSVICKNK